MFKRNLKKIIGGIIIIGVIGGYFIMSGGKIPPPEIIKTI